MKDEEFLFYEDVREKAVTARSAHKHPSRGGCRLRQYTKKELRELNGEVKTYQLNAPITAEALRKMPQDIQRQYFQNIVDKYNVGPKAVGQMLGYTSSGAAYMLFKRLGIKYGLRPSSENVERFFSEFCGREPIQETEIEELAVMTTSSFSVCLSGKYSADSVLAALGANIPTGQACRITIEVALLE